MKSSMWNSLEISKTTKHSSWNIKKDMITWRNIDVYKKERSTIFSSFKKKSIKEKHILRKVDGVAYPGEILVIIGPSGSGKTTLLNCITFRNLSHLRVTGSVTLNGQIVNQRKLARKSAYMQQNDLFIGSLSVKEHLIFQAMVRMDPRTSYDEILQRVEEVLIELSLKKCENSQIGIRRVTTCISGGERKRVALASELLTNPSLFFCDEPTTGLDSSMALNVLQILKSLAETGKTIVLTAHQPTSDMFPLFDKICLISEGKLAFLGTTGEADHFFTK